MAKTKKLRNERIEAYHAEYRKYYLAHRSGVLEQETLKTIEKLKSKAIRASDADYVLFFEAEKEDYANPPNYDHAIELVEEAICWQNDNKLAKDYFLYKTLALYYIRKADHAGDKELFQKSRGYIIEALDALQSPSSELCRLTGVVYFGLGKYDKAIEYYQKALSKDANDYYALLNYGNALAYKKDYAEAIEKYSAALKINKKDFVGHNNLALIYCKIDEYDKAIEHFDFVLDKIQANNLSSLNGKGYVYYCKKEYEKALEFWSKAFEINPNDSPLRYNKSLAQSIVAKKLDDTPKALSMMGEALVNLPEKRTRDYVKFCILTVC